MQRRPATSSAASSSNFRSRCHPGCLGGHVRDLREGRRATGVATAIDPARLGSPVGVAPSVVFLYGRR